METAIIVALISVAGSLAVCLINNTVQSKKLVADIKQEFAVSQAVTTAKIEELSNHVEKHNKVIERVYKLEQYDEVEKEQIKVINHRIEDLEGFHK
jgi:hypothetical protein